MRFRIGRFEDIFWHALKPLWIMACLYLLVRTLLLRHASPYEFGDAEIVELVYMSLLSLPTSALLYWTVYGRDWVSAPWPYPENDPRTIVCVWLLLFAIGCLNWFVLIPLLSRWIQPKRQDKDQDGSILKLSD